MRATEALQTKTRGFWSRIVLSNCGIDAVSIYPTYREPFDLIFERPERFELATFWFVERLNKFAHR